MFSTSCVVCVKYFYIVLIYFFASLKYCLTNDVFCGNLTVYQRKWLLESIVVIGSKTTSDLKQCLNICCNLANCQGVTFVGVIEKKIAQENCLLIGCYSECKFDASNELSEGVSIKISRSIQKFASKNMQSTDAPRNNILPGHILSALTPIWTIGLIIVISVFCVGLNITLISAYMCWRKNKMQTRKAHISTVTTLHAFNPA